MTLKDYAVRRLLQMVPVLLGVLVMNFVLIHIAPGDPASFLAGLEAPVALVERLRLEWGLNKPLHEQLFIYLSKFFQGDLGDSYRFRQPVIEVILERLPSTLLLTVTAFILSVLIGVAMGVSSSKRPFSLFDGAMTLFSVVFYSIPVFWLGIVFILAFSLRLGIFPVQGMHTVGIKMDFMESLIDLIWHMFLPVLTLTLVQLASYCRFTRASMLEELRKDYILTARAKGLNENQVFYTHAFKNALIPVITVMGMRLPYLFAGSLLIETVFAWSGIGRLMYQCILARDYPTLMGNFAITALLIMSFNFITDMIYAVVDPRIRYE